MTGWIFSVFSAVIIVSVISIVLPDGRTSKFVKPFISLVLILIIVSPIVKSDTALDGIFNASENVLETDADFLEYIAASKIDFYTKNCIKTAEKNGIIGSDILIKYNIDKQGTINIYGVSVNLQNAVISSESEHIVILQSLKKEISDYLKIEESGVEFYE